MRRNVSIILPAHHESYDRRQTEEFEQFILPKFASTDFTCLPAQKTNDLDNVYTLSSHRPSFVFSYEQNKKKGFFAVECKWRKKDYNGYMPWTDPNELRNYRDYQEKMNTPMFIILGLGGVPSDPINVLLIPFRYISELPVLDMHYLKAYFRPLPHKKFFLDTENMVLK